MRTTLNHVKSLLLVAIFGLGGLGLTGCEEGRFEDAGEEIDQAGDEMQDEMDEAGDEIE